MSAVRFNSDFQRSKIVGTGLFGTVYRCVDGKTKKIYAVKKSRTSVILRNYGFNEVSALKMTGFHQHIVHYISSWIEMNMMFIQLNSATEEV